MKIIDLRSDTVTHPTEAMRDAMARAEVGDDGYGDDPTVNRLQDLAAELLGKKAGLFVPTGTMANTLALMAHTGRGGDVVLEATSHIVRAELGAIATVAGLFHRTLPGTRGAMDLEQLGDAIQTKMGPRSLGTALVCMETTHNAAGGAVLAPTHMAGVRELAATQGIPVHLDGARLFNAATALDVPAADLAVHADSVCFCVSKALSAPVGSVLCGDDAFIARARTFRRILGGAMRQAGILAAAGIIALEEMTGRLGEDHAMARYLVDALHRVDPSLVDPDRVETNIVMVDLKASGRRADVWADDLANLGVRANVVGPYAIRLLTHRHIGAAEIDEAVAIIAKLWSNSEGP
jgi:threonine aldolase